MNQIEAFMGEALLEAECAGKEGEVPVGSIVVNSEGEIIGRGRNGSVHTGDPTAHAEIVAIREGARFLKNYRMTGCSLFVTLEPCPMCAGALVTSRIERVYFGARDPKGGGLVSRYGIGSDGTLNHSLQVVGGVLEDECASLLREFFTIRRVDL